MIRSEPGFIGRIVAKYFTGDKGAQPRDLQKESEKMENIDSNFGSGSTLKSTSDFDGSNDALRSKNAKGLTREQFATLLADKNNGNTTMHRNRNPNVELLNVTRDEPKAVEITDHFAEQLVLINEFKEDHPMYDMTYFLFKLDHPLRQFCRKLTGAKNPRQKYYFNWFISIAVVVSTFILATDTPLSRKRNLDLALSRYADSIGKTYSGLDFNNPTSSLKKVLVQSEYLSRTFYIGETVFAAIFTIEFILYTISDGILFTPNAYLLHPWNWLDLVVLISMWLGITTQFVAATGLPRFIRAIRALRPLRLINLWPGLKSIILLVLQSMVRQLILGCVFLTY